MVTHRISAAFLRVAILLVGALVGGVASGAYAIEAPHPCQEMECDSHWIFWERCEENPGRETFCGMTPGEKGCFTDACGHK